MFRPPTRFSIRFGPPPITLQPGESIIASDTATELAGKVVGSLVLTNQRLIFEPAHGGAREARREGVNLPLAEVTVLGLRKPLLFGMPLLLAGRPWHNSEYMVRDAADWLETIQRLRAGETPTALVPAPAPPAGESGAPPEDPSTLPRCPICGSVTTRQPDGSLRCLKCSPDTVPE